MTMLMITVPSSRDKHEGREKDRDGDHGKDRDGRDDS